MDKIWKFEKIKFIFHVTELGADK